MREANTKMPESIANYTYRLAFGSGPEHKKEVNEPVLLRPGRWYCMVKVNDNEIQSTNTIWLKKATRVMVEGKPFNYKIKEVKG